MPSDTRYPSGDSRDGGGRTASGTAVEEDSWLLYIVECRDGSFYTGVTNNLERRLKQHNDGDASRYTRSRRPVVLRYQEPCTDRSAALIRELAVKLLSRSEKETLISSPQPTRT